MGIFTWETNMWMETAHWNLKQLLAYLLISLFLLLITFPFGVTICTIMFLWDVIKGSPSPVHEGDGKKKTVAIIGGGVSGITSAVCMVEEGHDVVIFEKDHTWGGVWQFSSQKRNDNEDFSGQVWQNLITTSSAYITSFSAFAPPQEFDEHKEHPFHMTADQYFKYLTAYMKNGNVQQSQFRFNTEVQNMRRVDDKWELSVLEEEKEKKYNFVADWVIISTGQHQTHKEPPFAGLSDFKGEVVHSSDYVNPKPFVGQRVLIIGGGDSGADIVKHIADVCKRGECYMSLRRGAHVAPRYYNKDTLPIDYAMYRMAYSMPHILRTKILRFAFRNYLKGLISNGCELTKQIMRLHNLNGETASTYFTTKSEEMCKAFADGSAQLKPEVERFTEDGCTFKVPQPNIAGVSSESVSLDKVILCTGFTTEFPMLPEKYREHEHLDRYRLVFHPGLENVAFIGFVRPTGFGAIPPCSEMQARWAAQVVSGKVDLPSKEFMMKHAASVKERYKKVRVTNNQMLVFFPYYLAEIAHQFGANPHMFKIFMTDPKLWLKIMWGPYTSHQYRLTGPHAKPDIAKEMILQKITYPVKGKNVHNGPVVRVNRVMQFGLVYFFGVIGKIPYFGRPFAPCI